MDGSSAPKSGNRLRGSHGTSTPNRSDDVLAEGRALLTSETLASRVVNKQKQSLVWPARDRGQASINKLTFDKKCKMSVCYSSSNARCAVYNSVMVCIINMIEVINGENVIYACGYPSRRTRAKPACSFRMRAATCCSFFSSANPDLILRSLVPPGTRRLEGWPHRKSHVWNLCASERKIRPYFNALIIGDNNWPLPLLSHAPGRMQAMLPRRHL